MNLADVAFALRFFNLDDEEESQIPAPWGYQNIPQATRAESTVRIKVGRNPDRLTYVETREWFADGSTFAFASS